MNTALETCLWMKVLNSLGTTPAYQGPKRGSFDLLFYLLFLYFGLAFLISASRRQDGNKKKLFSDLDETPCAPVTLVFAKNFFSYQMCNLAPLLLPLSLFGSFHSSWSGRPCVCSHRGPQALHESSKWCFSIPALDSPLQKFLVLLQTNSIS